MPFCPEERASVPMLMPIRGSIACGDDADRCCRLMRAAAALELIHCASLVHDDLPCFDDADIRTGQGRSVHQAHIGEEVAVAVLAGDTLIIRGLRDPRRWKRAQEAATAQPG